jgi:hypothetical protein
MLSVILPTLAPGWFSSFMEATRSHSSHPSSSRTAITQVRYDPIYLCLYTDCDTQTQTCYEYCLSQLAQLGGFQLRWVTNDVWAAMRDHVRKNFVGVTEADLALDRRVRIDRRHQVCPGKDLC